MSNKHKKKSFEGTPHWDGTRNQTGVTFPEDEENMEATGRVESLKEEVRARTDETINRIKTQGKGLVAEQQGRAALELQNIAAAIRNAGEKLEDDGNAAIAGYTESLASQVERLSSFVLEADAEMLMQRARQFVRRRPEVVLGGLFVAGLALARFLKASKPNTLD